MSRPLRAKKRECGLNDRQRAEHIGLEIRAGFLDVDLFDRSHIAVASNTQDHIEAPKMLMRLIDRTDHLIVVGNVESEWQQRIAVLLLQDFE